MKVTTISKNEYERTLIQDARSDKEKRIQKSGRIRGGIANLKKVGAVKKSVQVLGVVRDSHD